MGAARFRQAIQAPCQPRHPPVCLQNLLCTRPHNQCRKIEKHVGPLCFAPVNAIFTLPGPSLGCPVCCAAQKNLCTTAEPQKDLLRPGTLQSAVNGEA